MTSFHLSSKMGKYYLEHPMKYFMRLYKSIQRISIAGYEMARKLIRINVRPSETNYLSNCTHRRR